MIGVKKDEIIWACLVDNKLIEMSLNLSDSDSGIGSDSDDCPLPVLVREGVGWGTPLFPEVDESEGISVVRSVSYSVLPGYKVPCGSPVESGHMMCGLEFDLNSGNPLIGESVTSSCGLVGKVVDYVNDNLLDMYGGEYVVEFSDGSVREGVTVCDFVSMETAHRSVGSLDVNHLIVPDVRYLRGVERPSYTLLSYRAAWNELSRTAVQSVEYEDILRLLSVLSDVDNRYHRRCWYDYSGNLLSKGGRNLRRRVCDVPLFESGESAESAV